MIFANRSPRRELSINRADLPTREIRELITFAPEGEFFDHDWSPDSRWLALSTQPTRTAPPSLYLVSMDGEIREISLPVPEDAQVCIGWFAQEVYGGGNADLCNFMTHIG